MSTRGEQPGDAGPPPAHATLERHKQRWSYRYRCWSIDLTRVTSNLPHQLDSDAPAFEIEIELADTTELFVRPVPCILEWGGMLVDDACSLMQGKAAGKAAVW